MSVLSGLRSGGGRTPRPAGPSRWRTGRRGTGSLAASHDRSPRARESRLSATSLPSAAGEPPGGAVGTVADLDPRPRPAGPGSRSAVAQSRLARAACPHLEQRVDERLELLARVLRAGRRPLPQPDDERSERGARVVQVRAVLAGPDPCVDGRVEVEQRGDGLADLAGLERGDERALEDAASRRAAVAAVRAGPLARWPASRPGGLEDRRRRLARRPAPGPPRRAPRSRTSDPRGEPRLRPSTRTVTPPRPATDAVPRSRSSTSAVWLSTPSTNASSGSCASSIRSRRSPM